MLFLFFSITQSYFILSYRTWSRFTRNQTIYKSAPCAESVTLTVELVQVTEVDFQPKFAFFGCFASEIAINLTTKKKVNRKFVGNSISYKNSPIELIA